MEESWHPEDSSVSKKRMELTKLKEYLDEHYTEKISLDELSIHFFINKYYLTKIFKETYGTTINSYIIAKRITRAKQMILQHDTPEDFVIATGEQHTVRDFTEKAFAANGITIRWEGEGINEKGYDGADGCQITTEAAAEILAEIEKLDIFDDVKRISFEEGFEAGKISYISEEVYTAFIEEVKKESVLGGTQVNKDVAIVYIFGMEESYGYLSGSYVRDKDGVNAAFLICEMFAYYASRGIGLFEKLNELYEEYGYCLNTLHSYTFEGSAGFEKMQNIMASFRKSITEFAGKKVLKCLDYSRGIDGLPKSDVLKFFLEDNCSIVVRPSGTEPKLKAYISVSAATKEEAQVVEGKLARAVEEKM